MTKHRVVVFLGIFLTLFLGFIYGCGSSGGHNYAAQYYGLGTLSGNIALSNANPSLRLQASGTPAIGADVWVEELPTLRATTDSSGNYIIKNVPIGNFHVAAKLISGGNTYKMRSSSCQLKAGDEAKNDFSIFPANNIVKGVIKNEDGQALPPGTQIWLWGESFTIDENGHFETPPLPTFAGLDAVHEIIVNRGLPNEFRIPLSFVAADQPLEVDLTVPANQGHVTTMPKVTLVATVNGDLSKKVMQGDQVTFTAIVFPADSSDLIWNTGRGIFNQSTQTDGNKRIKTWIAPSVSGLATVSVELKNAEGKIAKAFLPILVEGVPNYFVNFNVDGGSVIASQTIVRGQKVAKPADPVKQGYTFSGWFKDPAKITVFDFTVETITSNTTIYAKWTVKPTYSVTYNGNGNTGGDVPVDSNKYEEAVSVTVLGNTGNLVKDSVSFSGWNTKADGTGTDYSSGTSFVMSNSDIILYAKWTLNSHTVTFNSNGGDTEASPATKTVNHGQSVESLPAEPTRSGYDFYGWNTNTFGSGVDFDATTIVNGDLTVYAIWRQNSFTVSFDNNGGDTEADPTTKVVTTRGGNVGTLPAAPTRTGYNFTSWNTAADGSGSAFAAVTGVYKDQTVYAQWAVKTYTVIFDKNGGDTASNPATKLVNHGSSIGTLPTPPTRARYDFNGWNTNIHGSGADFDANTIVNGNLTVFATWRQNSFTVSFDNNGGDTEANPITKEVTSRGGNVGTLPVAPTRTGYNFTSWNTAADGSGSAFAAVTGVYKDQTVFAQWAIKTHTVIFDKNGGDTASDPTTKLANHGGNVGTLPDNPTRANYLFNGWNTESDGSGTNFTATTSVTANDTVYAQWLFWTFGSEGTENGQFKYPHGIAIDASGNIYVTEETNPHRVQKFNRNGDYLSLLGGSGSANGQFNNPTDIEIDSSGNLFVLDRANYRIQKFDPDGNYIDKFGSEGTEDGQFIDTRGMAIDSSGNIYVADFSAKRVQKFNSSGQYVRKFGSSGTDDGQFSGAFDVAVDASDNIYVTDFSNKNVQKFDSDGGFLLKFGTAGTGVGELNGPNGIAVDSSGNIYVTDWRNNCVQKYNSAGNFISQVGSTGSGKLQFDQPRMIAISGNKLIVTECNNHRVQIIDKF